MNQLGQKVSTSIGVAAIILVAVVLVSVVFRITNQIDAISASISSSNSLIPDENKPHACTEEAKICPDGSAVGRTGPNCKFGSCDENL